MVEILFERSGLEPRTSSDSFFGLNLCHRFDRIPFFNSSGPILLIDKIWSVVIGDQCLQRSLFEAFAVVTAVVAVVVVLVVGIAVVVVVVVVKTFHLVCESI